MTRILIVLLALAVSAAQDAPRFRAGVEVVRVDVLVTDGNRPIGGLTAADFDLRDSGTPQRIQAVTTGDVPVSMLLALDTSTSVKGSLLSRLKEASNAALDALGPADRAALLTFSSPVTLAADWAPPSPSMREAIADVQAGGSTALFDAAFTALLHRDTVPGNRSLVVLFSDGADTVSWLPSHAVLDQANRTDAVVYSVVLEGAGRETTLQYRSGIQLRDVPDRPVFEAAPFARELAEATGGSILVAEGGERLRETFAQIVTEFHSRYVLTYTPEGASDPGWHPIEVKVKNRRARIVARRGYTK